MFMREAYIVAMMRSPIGRKISLSPQELSRQVLEQLFLKNSLDPKGGSIAPASLPPKLIDFFAIGSAISLKTPNQATHKEIAMLAGMESASSESIDNACSSALSATHRAAGSIWHEGADFAVAGGLEIMSADADATKRSLTDPSSKKMMYQLADEFAYETDLSKLAHDAYSAESYKRARKYLYNTGPTTTIVMESGMMPEHFLVCDELIAAHGDFDLEKVSKFKPIKGCEIISYASSSKYGDGAAFIVFASCRAVKTLKLKPLAKFTAFAQVSGSTPKNFVAEPVKAIAEVLKKRKLNLDQIDYYLMNEAFATSPLHFMRMTEVLHEKINPRGGAIACGHPLGMSGARLVIEAVHILNQENKGRIIVSLCHATDGATAGLIEAV